MRLEERRVATSDLQVGMYVCRLDRSWEGTSFPLQGVMIRTQEDIDRLAQYSRHVYVDTELGIGPHEGLRLLDDGEVGPAGASPGRRKLRHYASDEIHRLRARTMYVDTMAFDDELPRARDARGIVAGFATRMLEDVRLGRALSADEVRSAVEPMVESVLRNADAFLWVDRLRQRGEYAYSHALGCSALCAAFGRHIGFPEDLLVDMAIGGLLLDVGKLRVDGELVDRAGPLTPDEMARMRAHVGHGLAIVDEGRVVPRHVREMIAGHHEREDGSGYPDGLGGDRVPLLAKIAGLIDSFEAMTSERPWAAAVSRHDALQALYRDRGTLYAPELVEQLMQCLGVYPTGSLVELSSGEVALVMGQNLARRLKPKVMVLTAPDKTLLQNFRAVDLMTHVAYGEPVTIVETLLPGAYGLVPQELFL